jgi:hypothetical protein
MPKQLLMTVVRSTLLGFNPGILEFCKKEQERDFDDDSDVDMTIIWHGAWPRCIAVSINIYDYREIIHIAPTCLQ